MDKTRRLARPRRGEVYLVDFDPTIGSEIKKTRPGLVIQNDVANRESPITIVAAITSRFEEPLYPTEVLIRPPEGGLGTDSVALLNQIRSIDKTRLLRRLGTCSRETVERVNQAIRVALGLFDLR